MTHPHQYRFLTLALVMIATVLLYSALHSPMPTDRVSLPTVAATPLTDAATARSGALDAFAQVQDCVVNQGDYRHCHPNLKAGVSYHALTAKTFWIITEAGYNIIQHGNSVDRTCARRLACQGGKW